MTPKNQKKWQPRLLYAGIFIVLSVAGILLIHHNPLESRNYIDTIHGKVHLSDPILQELHASSAFQRLKKIHQYGTYEISHPLPENMKYTRYAHSLGVLKMLQLAKEKGADISRSQMVAALMHDCSHTAFSHATDPLFMGGFDKGNYHDAKHGEFLKKHGVLEIAKKYGFSLEDLLPDNPKYTALEQPKPKICADRLEYNLYSGYLTKLLTDEDRQAILDDICFEQGQWIFTKPELALKLARVSLNDALNTWGSSSSLLTGIHASKALKIMVDKGFLSLKDIQYNKSDEEIWQLMSDCPLSDVQQCVTAIRNIDQTYKTVPLGEHDMILKGKFCGLDPFIRIDGRITTLTELNPQYRQEFLKTKEIVQKGIPIKFVKV